MTQPTSFYSRLFSPRSPSPEPPPEISDLENLDHQILDPSSRIPPPIVNRDAERLSQYIPFNLYGLFLEIQNKLDEGDDISYEEIAEQIFQRHLNEFQYLHQTPLKRFNDLLVGFCIHDGIEENCQETILAVFSAMFALSLLNSSLKERMDDLERSITKYLHRTTTFNHFQSVIQRGKKALEQSVCTGEYHEVTQEIQSTASEIDQLLGLYSYIEEDGPLFEHLIRHAYIEYQTPQFPNAKRFYLQFKSALESRAEDSPLHELKAQLHAYITRILQSNTCNSHQRSAQDIFCDIEAEAIWLAGMKILRTAYQASYPNEPDRSDKDLYQMWSQYSQESFLDSKEIVEKFIRSLSADSFNDLSNSTRLRHDNEDSIELKNMRANIIFRGFRFNFRFSLRQPLQAFRLLTFENLKKWCAT